MSKLVSVWIEQWQKVKVVLFEETSGNLVGVESAAGCSIGAAVGRVGGCGLTPRSRFPAIFLQHPVEDEENCRGR